MKTKKIVMFMTLGAILLNSCAKDNTNTPNNEGAVKFSSMLDSNLKTALAGNVTTWVNTDQIGIYMVNNGTPLNANNIASGADNIPYTADPYPIANIADFNPLGNPIYYPRDASQQVNFIAYYPYSANQTGNFSYPIDLSNQNGSTALAHNDLLYASNGVAYDKGSGNVSLQFQHVLARMVIHIKPGIGLTADDLKGLTVAIRGYQLTANFDLASNSLKMTNSNDSLSLYTSPDGTFAEAILLPQLPFNLTVDFKLTKRKAPYKWRPTPIEINAASQYIYDVQINHYGYAVLRTKRTIIDWPADQKTSTPIVN